MVFTLASLCLCRSFSISIFLSLPAYLSHSPPVSLSLSPSHLPEYLHLSLSPSYLPACLCLPLSSFHVSQPVSPSHLIALLPVLPPRLSLSISHVPSQSLSLPVVIISPVSLSLFSSLYLSIRLIFSLVSTLVSQPFSLSLSLSI
jgi:hypothetical protein